MHSVFFISLLSNLQIGHYSSMSIGTIFAFFSNPPFVFWKICFYRDAAGCFYSVVGGFADSTTFYYGICEDTTCSFYPFNNACYCSCLCFSCWFLRISSTICFKDASFSGFSASLLSYPSLPILSDPEIDLKFSNPNCFFTPLFCAYRILPENMNSSALRFHSSARS
jgi:hypothetical protein